MNTILIGYDLNKSVQNYTKLIERIKQYSNWCHPVDSTWIVKTNSSCSEVRDALTAHTDSNDELIVVKLSGNWATMGMSSKINDWLKTNL